MMKIVLATRNKGKIREIREMLKDAPVEVLTLEDFPALTLPPEDGATFEENALKKARFVARETGLAALADDSGLEVEGLQGRPGVRSARYAGPSATDEDNVEKLLKELEGRPPNERSARFRCSAAFADPAGGEAVFEGTLDGVITEGPRGASGFGYDPVFLLPDKGKTVAELTTAEKNSLSHRGRAVRRFMEWIQRRKVRA